MYFPEPGPDGITIAVGDVDYVDEGRFYRLFNASLPEDDPSNVELGIPEGFEPLRITGVAKTKNYWRPGAFTGTTVRQSSVTVSMNG